MKPRRTVTPHLEATLVEPTDSTHLKAAEGWLGLGNFPAASAELDKISPGGYEHPDTLEMRWHIMAHAQQWDSCLAIADTLIEQTPDRISGWIHRAHTLVKLNRTLEAKSQLLSVVREFEPNAIIPYYLARFCCALGHVGEAKEWLRKAMDEANGQEELELVRNLVSEDYALEPLRTMAFFMPQ